MDFNLIARNFDVLGIQPPSKLILLEAQTLSSAHVPPFPPDIPVLLTHVSSPELASHVKDVLLTTYPQGHVVFIVESGKRKEVRLNEVGSSDVSEDLSLYIPP